MAGDEIVAEWLGDMYSNNYTSTTAPQRFSATSLRFKNVSVFNYHASNTLYVGKFYTTQAEFQLKSPFLTAFETKEYEFVDLYELGFANGTGVTVAKLTGINEY